MAYYCEVFDVTRPSPGVIMIHFNMHDDADGSVVQGPMTHGFNVTKYDAQGQVVAETGDQKINRMAAEFNAYTERIMTDVTLVDQHFAYVQSIAIGYRYPAAG